MRPKSLRTREDGVLHFAADILEINVDTFATRLIERGAEIGAAMVERCIETELVLDVAALVGPAGDTDDPRTVALRKLTGHGANRARCGRHDDGLAGFRLADIGEADIGGHARHPQNAERGRDRRLLRVELQEAIARHCAVELPAITAHRVVAFAETGVVRVRDLADDTALDDLADFGGAGIGALSADAAAHVRVERQIDAAQ